MTTAKTSANPSGEPSEKFAFGRNWRRFLETVDEPAVDAAKESLRRLLHVESLESKRFLDAGSGSGLFSLAAYELGASVISFDADADSVACTNELRKQSEETERWFVRQGSLLDRDFLATLKQSDIVYCWGVAHHTGDMWRAIDNLIELVSPNGQLVLALYNDEQYVSRVWSGIKSIYQRVPEMLRPVYVLAIWCVLFLRRLLLTFSASLLRLLTLRNPLAPFVNWFRETRDRGMNSWYDLVDWVGGWPFEVARPEEVFRALRDRGFTLTEMTTSGGHGCNEFVFRCSQQGTNDRHTND